MMAQSAAVEIDASDVEPVVTKRPGEFFQVGMSGGIMKAC
jgi:hypothetical protein